LTSNDENKVTHFALGLQVTQYSFLSQVSNTRFFTIGSMRLFAKQQDLSRSLLATTNSGSSV